MSGNIEIPTDYLEAVLLFACEEEAPTSEEAVPEETAVPEVALPDDALPEDADDERIGFSVFFEPLELVETGAL